MGRKFTAQQMIDAILAAEGNLSAAARALDCSRMTVHRYVNDYSTVKDAYHDAVETKIDHVESKLHENIDKGSVTAQMYYLSTKGKHRGYVKRQEMTGADGEDIQVSFVWKPKPVKIFHDRKGD